MKRIISVILGVLGFVIAWGAVSTAEASPDFTTLQLVGYTYLGFMLMGMSFAVARWK